MVDKSKPPNIDLESIVKQLRELESYHSYVCNEVRARNLRKAIRLIENVHGMYMRP